MEKIKTIDEILEEYGITDKDISNKEKLELLRNIKEKLKVDYDCEELRYTSGAVARQEDYFKNVNEISLKIHDVSGAILRIKSIETAKKRANRKQALKKVKSFFGAGKR